MTTEAEPTGGGGGTSDFYPEWTLFPKDYIVPGNYYVAAEPHRRFFVAYKKSVEGNQIKIPPKDFADDAWRSDREGPFLAFALGSLQWGENPWNGDQYMFFPAIIGERIAYILLDANFGGRIHISTRDTLRKSLRPLDPARDLITLESTGSEEQAP
jgi:hypothetical protein